jgi:hypothetical protein
MTTLKSTAAAVLVLTACAFSATSVSAANIATRPENCTGTCDIGLFGKIVQGDADKFIKLIAERGITKAAVYLNSPGGDLLDGLRIGQESVPLPARWLG